MVDRFRDNRPRCPRPEALLRHRRDRVPRHRAGRAAAPAVPGSEVVLLIRPGRRATPMQRAAEEILKNDCFDRLREEHGDRSTPRWRPGSRPWPATSATDGLGLDDEGRRTLSTCDIVIHSAATVSFDSPLDAAVEVNLLGPSRVAAAVVGPGPTPPPRAARARPLHPRLHGLRGRHPPGRGQRGVPRAQPLQPGRRLAVRGRRGPAPAGRRRGRVPPSRTARASSPGPPGASSAVPGSTCWPSGPSACARTG